LGAILQEIIEQFLSAMAEAGLSPASFLYGMAELRVARER